MAGNAEGAGVQRAMQGQCKKRAQAQRHGPTVTTKLSFACPLVAMEFGPKHGAIAADGKEVPQVRVPLVAPPTIQWGLRIRNSIGDAICASRKAHESIPQLFRSENYFLLFLFWRMSGPFPSGRLLFDRARFFFAFEIVPLKLPVQAHQNYEFLNLSKLDFAAVHHFRRKTTSSHCYHFH